MPSSPREYGRIVEQVLKTVSDGPWTTADLESAREIIDDDWCSSHAPDCKSQDILDWLDSMDEERTEELLFSLSSENSDEQDHWALS